MLTYIIIAVIIFVIGTLLLFISMYNNMINLKMKVQNAWAQIETQLKRRFDLIPNMVETVKGYMNHEEETLTKVIEARNKFTTATNISDKSNADNILSGALKSIFALSEAYPDLKANSNFIQLQNDLKETEDKIAYSRQFYNDTVQMYNTAIMSFPGNIFAKMFNFKEENFFEANQNEKENIKVEF